jgi:hypothetical protein
MRIIHTTLFIIFTVLLFLISCQREVEGTLPENPQPSVEQTVTASVAGRIVDEKNNPVKGALIQTTNGASTTTDINGQFSLQNVVLNKNAGYIKVEKAGYFTGSRTFVTSTTSTNITEIQLIPKTAAGSFASGTGGNITIPNGGTIVFPSNSIITASNNTTYSGNVSVAAYFLNPAFDEFDEIMPGALRGRRTDSSEVVLQSFGMVAVELSSASGEKLQLANGKTAIINLPIASSLLSAAPATIPLWYFDETKGLWKEEGVATKQGNSYVGVVSHFSFWNCDAPFPLVDFKASFKNQNGNPLLNAKAVIYASIGKQSIMASAIIDEEGSVSGKIPANSNLYIEIVNSCEDVIYSKSFTTTTSSVNLGSTTITNTLATVTISGALNGCNSVPVANGFIHIAIGNLTYRTAVVNGSFSATMNVCRTGTLSALLIGYDVGNNKQGDSTIITVNTTTPATVQLSACGATVDQFINYTLNGTNFSLISPVDSLSYFTQGGNDYIYAISKSNNNKVSMALQSVTATGVKPIQFIGISTRDTSFVGQNITSVTITEYNSTATGIYIAGNLSGTVQADSLGNISRSLNLSFRIKK